MHSKIPYNKYRMVGVLKVSWIAAHAKNFFASADFSLLMLHLMWVN